MPQSLSAVHLHLVFSTKDRHPFLRDSTIRSETHAYLDAETAKLDALVAKVEEAVERLQEYRSALITAAVTGKIDVRKQVEPC